MFHRPNGNAKKTFAKYLKPSAILNKGNSLHSRSMVELNPSDSLNKENHFNSCASSNSNSNMHAIEGDNKSQKSNSISKALKTINSSKNKPNGISKLKKNQNQVFSCSIAQMKGYAPDSTNRSSRNISNNHPLTLFNT